MYSEVSSIFSRAERLWREVLATEILVRNAGEPKQGDCNEASAKQKQTTGEEDFLWCWQHRGFW
jgi:hypothetical protein